MEGENRRNQGGQQHLQPQEVPQEIRPLPNQQCPRCLSTDTKFSYFNNNKRSQPRYLCSSCRRLWTQGGILRNIPPREWPVRRTRRGAEVLRVAISSPPPCVGLSAGGGFKLATQNSSRPQEPEVPQLIFTRGNHLSLPGINYLNHFANPFLCQVQVQGPDPTQVPDPGQVQVHGPGQGDIQVQGQDKAKGQVQVQVHGQGQVQDLGQIQRPPTIQLHQEPKPIEGIAALPNRVTWMHRPTSVTTTTTTNYLPPLDDDADIYYWDKNIKFNVGGSSSGSSLVDWLAQFRGFDP